MSSASPDSSRPSKSANPEYGESSTVQGGEKAEAARGRFTAIGAAAKQRGRELVVPRRSLLLTGGVMLAGGLLAAVPHLAAAGILGEEAGASVSQQKLLARRERLIRESLDTRYLKIESLGVIYVGQGREEKDLRLVGSLSLTEAGRANLGAVAAALARLGLHGSMQRLSLTYGGVDPLNDPQEMGNRVESSASPLRVNETATLTQEQWLTFLSAQAALGTRIGYSQVTVLSKELRLSAVVTATEYGELLSNTRKISELGASDEQFKPLQLYVQMAPEGSVQLPSGAQAKVAVSVAEPARALIAVDALERAATVPEFEGLGTFSLTWNARQDYPNSGQWDALKLSFKAPASPDVQAKEELRKAIRSYLSTQSGPLGAVSKREGILPGEVIAG